MAFLPRFRRDQRGSTVVEFGLIFMLLLLLTLGGFEMSLMLWQWVSAEKATQAGLRHAIVSDLVAPSLSVIGTEPLSAGSEYGDWCRDRSTDTAHADCWFDPVTCIDGSCTGGYGYDAAAFTAIFDRMRALFPQVERANVEVLYEFSGFGFIGRPGGQPMMVTVRLRNMNYAFLVINALTALPASIPMPSFAATMVGEDLSDTP